jgi:hypothetical protein
MEQGRERLQHGLGALEVIDLLDLVRRHSLVEVGLQGIQLVLRYGMEVGGGGACQVVDHRKAYQLPVF